MAFRLTERPERDQNSGGATFGLLVVGSIIVMIELIYWSRTGCFLQRSNSPEICGIPATMINAVITVALIASWARHMRRSRAQEWEPYDPLWLVEIASRELPDEPWLHEALRKCVKSLKAATWSKVVYFVDPSSADLEGSEWQYKESIVLETFEKGPVILDILKDGRVGSATFSWVVADPTSGDL